MVLHHRHHPPLTVPGREALGQGGPRKEVGAVVRSRQHRRRHQLYQQQPRWMMRSHKERERDRGANTRYFSTYLAMQHPLVLGVVAVCKGVSHTSYHEYLDMSIELTRKLLFGVSLRNKSIRDGLKHHGLLQIIKPHYTKCTSQTADNIHNDTLRSFNPPTNPV